MSATDRAVDQLESAIAGVYDGPLEDFVRRRDALAKELRSAGDRESASSVKALRKPSRLAWALNLGARSEGNVLEPLAAAVTGMLAAQAAGGDVRAAITTLRAAVRDFAAAAARAADAAGHGIEAGALVTAVLAVVGRPDQFDRLRSGCLDAVPEGGGLDFLAALPVPSKTPVVPAPADAPVSTPTRARPDSARRAAAQQAAELLAEARRRSDAARQALRAAEAMRSAAEARLRDVEAEAQAAREEYDRAQREAEAAAASVREAEGALAERKVVSST